MKLKRSALPPCPECSLRKGLDWKIYPGGNRYMDLYAIECVYCGIRAPLVNVSPAAALSGWEEFVKDYEKPKELGA